MSADQPIVVILGPTAGGKSDVAVAVAEALGGQIIGADSMQVYRHLNAGTAKPTPAQRAAVPHHMIDHVEPTETWTVAQWLEAAESLIEQMHQQNRMPVVVGGTHLYMQALLVGLFDGPGIDPAFRQSLASDEPARLHHRLREVDPDAADRIHPNDRKRIVRALEVHHLSGRPISQWQQQWDPASGKQHPYRHHPILIGLRWSAEAINRRINARVKTMFHPPDSTEDLISETRRLEAAGLLGNQARQALGTKPALEHLAGRLSADEAMEKVKIETRRFAKSQRTWLKRFRGVRWIEAEKMDGPERALEAVEIARNHRPSG